MNCVATALMGIIIAGTIVGLPPFGWIAAWNEDIKTYWEVRATPMPYAHAEESTLREFSARIEMPVDDVIGRLKAAGLSVPDDTMTLGEISEHNRTTPSHLFVLLKADVGAKSGPARSSAGGGRGMKTIEQLCNEMAIDVGNAVLALEKQGISASPEKTLRELASTSGLTPREIAEIISAVKP